MSVVLINLSKVRPLAEEELPAPVPGRILACFFTNERTSIQRAARRDAGQAGGGQRALSAPHPHLLSKTFLLSLSSDLPVAQENQLEIWSSDPHDRQRELLTS